MGVVRPALLPTEIIWIRWPPHWRAVLIYGLENQSMQSAPVTRQALRFGNLLSSFRGGVSANAESYRKQIFKIPRCAIAHLRSGAGASSRNRSEEHTSELQSHLNLVCRLLLEK